MSTIAASPALPRRGLDIGLALKQAARLFIKDLAPLLIAALIAGVLSVLTLGILAGPLFAGLYGMVIGRVRDGRQPEVGDVFSGLDRFWSYAGAALALVVLVALASITIVGGFVLATIWLYVLPLMVDRGLSLGEAMKASKDMVVRAGFWEHLRSSAPDRRRESSRGQPATRPSIVISATFTPEVPRSTART